ncbi:hypothetical protein [Pseudoxanthomonas sp.]|uniref:hypothetical protein n=1 Tax=Pseudoxanthomonas sp. TaxID=1871049 RepID=UPI0025F10578|nr:hypothetical protein [Pseudoxanthomonas sp.]
MSESPNPYEAPTAVLPAPDIPPMPSVLLATLACYLAHYVLEVLSLWSSASVEMGMFLAVASVNGAYCLAMCVALWRRWQWARVWLVMTTVIAAFVLLMLVRRGLWLTEWMSTLASLLRIAVAGMLFLPPVRRWFARRPG